MLFFTYSFRGFRCLSLPPAGILQTTGEAIPTMCQTAGNACRLAAEAKPNISIMEKTIMELAQQFPGVSITIPAGELEKFGNALIEGTMKRYREDLAAREAEEREEKLLTAKEVAQKFGVCTKTVTRWRKAGIISPVPVGGLLKYRNSDCRRIIEERGQA